VQKYNSVAEFERAEPRKERCSGYQALGHLDPGRPLLVGGYGVNGPDDLSLNAAVARMLERRVPGDGIVRGVRLIASWTQRASRGRPPGAFSYNFIYAAEEEQEALRPFRDDTANRL
jgi:hypothetical protein